MGEVASSLPGEPRYHPEKSRSSLRSGSWHKHSRSLPRAKGVHRCLGAPRRRTAAWLPELWPGLLGPRSHPCPPALHSVSQLAAWVGGTGPASASGAAVAASVASLPAGAKPAGCRSGSETRWSLLSVRKLLTQSLFHCCLGWL